MRTAQILLGLVVVATLTGCGDDASKAETAGGGAGGTSGGGSGGAAVVGGTSGTATGGTSNAAGTAGTATGGMAPRPPFQVTNGICTPTPMPGPEPLYEIDSVFGHVGAMAAHHDVLYFGESADFDDIPPRLAKLEGAGPPTTVVDGARPTGMRIIADKLYYSEAAGLKSLDLTQANAEPTVLNQIAGIVTFNEKHVVYKGETHYYSAPIDAVDLSGAVALRPADDIYSVALAGDTLFLSSRDGVYRVGLDGTGAADVVPDDPNDAFIEMVQSDGTNVFYDDDDVLTVVPATGGTPRRIGRSGPDGLFDDTAAFSRILPAGDVVYWADDGESYGWTALDGMSCGILGTHDAFFEGGAALADSYLFAAGDPTIYRVDRVK